jgi:hypothetical protein
MSFGDRRCSDRLRGRKHPAAHFHPRAEPGAKFGQRAFARTAPRALRESSILSVLLTEARGHQGRRCCARRRAPQSLAPGSARGTGCHQRCAAAKAAAIKGWFRNEAPVSRGRVQSRRQMSFGDRRCSGRLRGRKHPAAHFHPRAEPGAKFGQRAFARPACASRITGRARPSLSSAPSRARRALRETSILSVLLTEARGHQGRRCCTRRRAPQS